MGPDEDSGLTLRQFMADACIASLFTYCVATHLLLTVSEEEEKNLWTDVDTVCYLV